ncbi:MAG: hypothetical protein WCL13_00155 [bacterium]
MDLNELGIRAKFEDEIERFNKFQGVIFGKEKPDLKKKEVDIRAYAKYLLKEGSIVEKRELLGNLRSRLVYMNKGIKLLTD